MGSASSAPHTFYLGSILNQFVRANAETMHFLAASRAERELKTTGGGGRGAWWSGVKTLDVRERQAGVREEVRESHPRVPEI